MTVSNYPAAIDTFVNPAASNPMSNPPHDHQHVLQNDAIVAIETELGLNPQKTDATVAARLARVDQNDPAANVPGRRSIGTGAVQASAGNHTHTTDSLADVVAGTPLNGQVLRYFAAFGLWVSVTL